MALAARSASSTYGSPWVVDKFGVDQEGELRNAVGDARRRPGVVGVRVDGDGPAAERGKRRFAGGALVVEAARGDDDELGSLLAHLLPRRRV
jgi:hypothetical protein